MSVFTRPSKVIGRSARGLLTIDGVNRAVFATRFLYLARIRRAVRASADNAAVIGDEHSMRMLLRGKTSNRPLRLIRPLSVIDVVSKDARVLSVGCRFETELLYLVGHGFSPRNVRGLDMISYSQWVDIGNMHAMPYGEDSWDVVILGWVLSYSDDPHLAAKEVIRVCRDGGVVAIGVAYYPRWRIEELEEAGSAISGSGERIQTVEGILALFEGKVGRVFFQHDAVDEDDEGACMVIFSIDKGPSTRVHIPGGAL